MKALFRPSSCPQSVCARRIWHSYRRKLVRRMLHFIVLCSLLVLCGCLTLKYEDVSKEAGYAPLVNTCYSLKTNMIINRIILPQWYGPNIDFYGIYPMWLRATGREIITEDILKQGTILKVQRVNRSTNHIPGFPFTEAVVDVKPFVKAVDVPATINLGYLSTNYMNKLNGVTNDCF
jgi:hypothetical protein